MDFFFQAVHVCIVPQSITALPLDMGYVDMARPGVLYVQSICFSYLQVVADFDRTLSKYTHRGQICSTCHSTCSVASQGDVIYARAVPIRSPLTGAHAVPLRSPLTGAMCKIWSDCD